MGTVLGIVVILAGVVFANGYMRRGTLTDQFEKVRKAAEASHAGQGVTLMQWELLRKTTGNRKSGPKFDPTLLDTRDSVVNIIGFMVPLYEFRAVNEFLLLPLPVQCYFCEAPPMRDVMLVQMAEGQTTDIVNEPIVVSGTLTLNEGPGTKFFYVMKDASRTAAEKGGKLTRKKIGQEAMGHAAQMKDGEQPEPELLPPSEPPAPAQP